MGDDTYTFHTNERRLMPETTVGLDLDLCRQIMLRLDELLVNQVHNSPTQYEFDGYNSETIGHNVQALHDARLVVAKCRSSWDRHELRNWPLHFHRNGLKFFVAIKDEADWEKAIEAMNAQTDKPDLKTLKSVLLDVVQKEAA